MDGRKKPQKKTNQKTDPTLIFDFFAPLWGHSSQKTQWL